MGKTLVIGATGTIGRALVAELAAAGQAVRAASRDPEAHTFPEGVEAVRFDYSDAATVGPATEGIDHLFLLSPPMMDEQASRQRALLDIAQGAGARHVVLLSAMGVPDDSPHGQSEAAVKGSGLDWTILRPSFFAQNFVTYVRDSILTEDAFYYPAGDGRIGYIDARDIAAVAAAVLTNPTAHRGQTYDLTGPEPLDHHQVAERLSAAAGRPIVYVDPGPEGYRSALRGAGMPEAIIEGFTHLYSVVVKSGWAAATTDNVERITGRPPVDFAAFAEEHASAWRAEEGAP